MTCVVGLVDPSGVWIGADSAESDADLNVSVRHDSKIFYRGDFLIAFAESFRVGQLLKYKLSIPRVGKKDLHHYMVTDFVDSIRKCLKESGACGDKSGGDSFPADTMVGYRDRLFVIYGDDYQVSEVSNGIQAIGCGREYALGAIMATSHLDPESRIRKALEIAAYYNAGVKPPFKIMKVPPGKQPKA